ncbi:hypothetical protein TKWG_02490 [Advenella kashmirensis WT001]|uniref:Uncharacterized protein n=1 Tax=Advenella kashmirensis (strain DSM 17095 / LMG 22695 / WT001) TaxID=1036672 RepID=I3U7Z2_ADVKW|nr:LysO family transporter [Advenella kashmirensis]AFK61130.1 hypothetical protein TKWG_02490 [Advenella kashmirensis WT001]
MTHDLGIMHVIRECGIALAFLLVGLGLAALATHWAVTVPVPGSEFFLYVLLFLIGADLAHTPLQRNAIRPAMFTLPLVVIVASLLAGASSPGPPTPTSAMACCLAADLAGFRCRACW